MHSLKTQHNLAPYLLVKKFTGGANSGSTWGWLLLEEVENSEIWSLGVGQMPVSWTILFFLWSAATSYEDNISVETLPIQLPTHTIVLTFFLLGALGLADPLHHQFFTNRKNKPNLLLPLLLHETRLDCWSHMFLYLHYYLLGLNCPTGFFSTF